MDRQPINKNSNSINNKEWDAAAVIGTNVWRRVTTK
jgi:hypothetical protein